MQSLCKILIMIGVSSLFINPGYCDVINVPGDQPTIQTAVDIAVNGDVIRIAAGTHSGFGNRDIDIQGKAIVIESESEPTSCVIDCQDYGRGFILDDQEGNDTIIRNLTIRNAFTSEAGGGIYCVNASPHIENCIFDQCSGDHAGGLGSYIGSHPVLFNCVFQANVAVSHGGAVFVSGSSATFDECIFTSNCALNGGGIGCGDSSEAVVVRNCDLSGNSATENGGAVIINNGEVEIYNSIVQGNSAGDYGGGIHMTGFLNPELTVLNCTFFTNIASLSGSGLSMVGTNGYTTATNCILWDNPANEVEHDSGTLDLTYSDVAYSSGSYPGVGNINLDPLFTSGSLGEFYLSQINSGQFEQSPCVNAGSNLASNICFDVPGGNVCMNEMTTSTSHFADGYGIVDIGYHYWPDAVTTPTPSPLPCTNHGDVNLDGEITAGDSQLSFLITLGSYSPIFEEECAADCNGDGEVTAGDAQQIFMTVLGSASCEDPISLSA